MIYIIIIEIFKKKKRKIKRETRHGAKNTEENLDKELTIKSNISTIRAEIFTAKD